MFSGLGHKDSQDNLLIIISFKKKTVWLALFSSSSLLQIKNKGLVFYIKTQKKSSILLQSRVWDVKASAESSN